MELLVTDMLRILSIILCAIAIQAQTNQKPYRLFVADGKLVTSGGKILNHQTYTVTRDSDTASGGFGYSLTVDQTNQLVETSLDDIDGFLSGINNTTLFAPTTGYYGTGPYRVVKGFMDSATAAGGQQSCESEYVSFTPDPDGESGGSFQTRGTFGVPMVYFMRPTVPLSELASLDIQSAGGALTQIQYYEADPEILNPFTNTVTQSGSSVDAISGFIAATANWASYSYEETYAYDHDFVTNGVDPITGHSWSWATGSHSLWEDINLADGWETPVDAAVWKFTAKKEYY